jgi:hypothetical protein
MIRKTSLKEKKPLASDKPKEMEIVFRTTTPCGAGLIFISLWAANYHH